jgi:parallel beta-helix repeat protein
MEDSVGNTISCNRISNNTSAGIKIRDSSQNKIFNNDFINNKPNHVDVYGSTNVWDSGYPQGGNYWDDWNDKARQPRIVDDKSGENQTLQGCDGIGDTQYSIKGDTQDRYPLLNQFNTSRLRIFDTPLTVKKLAPERTEKTSLIVAIFGDFAEIRNYTFNATNMADLKMIFDIDGGNFCNVIVPREILDGPFTVSIDNVTKEFMLCQDSTNTVAELNHGTRSHVEITVKLRGDMNGDGKVDITDLAMLARLYGLQIIP